MGRANAALARAFPHRPRSDSARNDYGLRDAEKGGRQREPCRQAARPGCTQTDYTDLRRNPRGPASRHVSATRLDDRQRHAVQHERKRGDLEPLLPAGRHTAGQQAPGSSERSREHVAVVERLVSVGDVHRRGRQYDRAPDSRGPPAARCDRREGHRMGGHREDRPHAYAGCDTAHARAGMVRLCGHAAGQSRPARCCAARRLSSCARRHGGRHRHQRRARVRGSRGGRNRDAHRPAVRERTEQVYGSGRARRADSSVRRAQDAGGVAVQDRQRYSPDVMRSARRLRGAADSGERTGLVDHAGQGQPDPGRSPDDDRRAGDGQ
ncbi:hypothetical protein LMG29542_08622 [Paraburkholderia humisilvae]|uniref:Uncharacterized protein n=1 Tax=Paraburkholderia humisilvae TaxID=627669 RepID=A0A6J5F8S3_9BURK|nr:hypothetical protein LMG29542_08622 [Paraburkholderia humisilvae]